MEANIYLPTVQVETEIQLRLNNFIKMTWLVKGGIIQLHTSSKSLVFNIYAIWSVNWKQNLLKSSHPHKRLPAERQIDGNLMEGTEIKALFSLKTHTLKQLKHICLTLQAYSTF